MRRGWVLALASLTIVLVVVDLTAVTIALPDIRSDLRASLPEVQWVVDAYALTLAAVLLPAGVLADRYGRRRLLVVGVSVFTLAPLACALAPTAPLLDLARGVLQAGEELDSCGAGQEQLMCPQGGSASGRVASAGCENQATRAC
ncbi:MFS transporter [Nonomuraea sp. NPDC049400]|uniref:MFS transporter n=1 Tax=Nonomuraea sp. NPDC049400 TaxID=3364352 RepID=UPI0037B0C64D